MKSRMVYFLTALICLFFFTGCGSAQVRIPITNPQMIDPKEARPKLMNTYTNHVAKNYEKDLSSNWDFWPASSLCTTIIRSGTLEGVKSSKDGLQTVMVYSSSDPSQPAYQIIVFTFNENATIYRSCYENGLCRVWIRNGSVVFGKVDKEKFDFNFFENKVWPTFVKGSRLYSEMLFWYSNSDKQQGEEIISLFLSAFPTLKYE